MVGHTGDIEATVVACKAADEAVKVGNHFNSFAIIMLWFWLSQHRIAKETLKANAMC